MTACAHTTNVACHSTVDGVSENSVQDRAQAVAMATKHPDSLTRSILFLILNKRQYSNG